MSYSAPDVGELRKKGGSLLQKIQSELSDIATAISGCNEGAFTGTFSGNVTGNVTGNLTGQHINSSETLTAVTAVVDPTKGLTLIDTTLGAMAASLADGTAAGQEITIAMIVDNGDVTLTPTTLNGYASVTIDDVGDVLTLVWVPTLGWTVKYNLGCTLNEE